MHRFWIFPLILGLVGAAYPVFCTAEAFVPHSYLWGKTLRINLSRELWDVFYVASPWGFGVGLLVGIVAAAREMARSGALDRSGTQATRRLLGNGWWLGCYALLFNGATWLLVWSFLQAGLVSFAFLQFWFPGVFFVQIGLINLVAIVWAARRTIFTTDILNPRVLAAKSRRSTQLTE